jgi:hypothetical protein
MLVLVSELYSGAGAHSSDLLVLTRDASHPICITAEQIMNYPRVGDRFVGIVERLFNAQPQRSRQETRREPIAVAPVGTSTITREFEAITALSPTITRPIMLEW